MDDHNEYPKPTGSNLVDLINLLLYEKKRQERDEQLIINGKVMPKLKINQAYTDDGTIVNL
jgi:hypothetical protein